MRFAHIKLAGFKSFADPTHIPIAGRMSGVVGPNGCGKSNVVDAIRWVMGERSASALRGEDMHDVIFNGSNQRPSMDRASVELHFHSVRLPADSPWSGYSELSIRRVIYRNQTSDYFINQQKVRRKDVADLFLGTGLGPRSYAIIEQGMVSKIIEANPKELRVFLEEAAGVSKYKERRHETENRLEDIRANLNRVEDIRVEVAAQVERLREQAAVAMEYQTLQNAYLADQRMVALIGFAGEIEAHRKTHEKLKAEEQQLFEWQTNIAEIDRYQAEKESAWQEAQSALEEAQSDLMAYNAMVVELEQDLRLGAQKREHLIADQQKLSARQENAKEQLVAQSEEEAILIQNLALAREDRKKTEESFTLQQKNFYAIEKATLETRQKAEHLRGEMTRLSHRLVADEQELIALSRRIDEVEKKAESAKSELAELDINAGEVLGAAQRVVVSPYANDLELLLAEGEELSEVMAQSAESLESTEGSARECHEQISGLRQQESGLQGRIHTLERQLKAMEGAKEELVSWLSARQMLASRPLSDSLKASGKWQHAIFVVLSEALSVRWLSAWQANTRDLPPSGRILISSDSPSVDAVLPKSGTLAEHINVDDPGFSPWVVNFLNHYHITDDWQTAIKDRQRLSEDEYWISPEGVQVGKRDMVFPGEGGKAAIQMENQRTMEAAKVELQNIGETLQGLLDEQGRLAKARERLKQTLEAQKHAKHENERKWRELSAKEQEWRFQTQSEREKSTWQRESLQKIIDECMADSAKWNAQKEGLESAIQEVREKVVHLKLSVDTEEAKRDENEANLRQQREALRNEELAVHKLQHQVEMIERDLARCKEIGKSIMRSLSDIEDQIEQVAGQMDDLPQADELDESLQEKLIARKAQEEKVLMLRKAVEAAFQSQKQSGSERQKLERQVETVRDKVEGIRLKIQEANLKAEQYREHFVRYGGDLASLATMDINNIIHNNAQSVSGLQSAIAENEAKMKALEPVNLAAISELEHESARLTELVKQQTDLTEALNTLQDAITRIDAETRTRMLEVFERVNVKFGELFRLIFGGGHAEIILTGEEILDAGVLLKAQPAGKNNASIHLLSGGEKALTAISLVFAFFSLNPAPFCVLDEVDAPLDDANTRRFTELIRDMSGETQFVVISHNRITMESMETLVGVTMREAGVSRVVSVDLMNNLATRGVEKAANGMTDNIETMVDEV